MLGAAAALAPDRVPDRLVVVAGDPEAVDDRAVPAAVFTDPEVATVHVPPTPTEAVHEAVESARDGASHTPDR